MKYLKTKLRIDEFLVENEYFENIDIAKRNIMAGNVIINEIKKEKSGEIIDISKIKSVRIKNKDIPYVSRGGLKLEKAIREFKLDLENKIILDIGASTGGFTDCSLQNGAKFVYAVDVGTNQLDWKLRTDSRVKSIENKHIKDLEPEDINNDIPDIIVMDISFISIKRVIDDLKKFMKKNTLGVFLIKPQFEVSKEFIEKGIVNDLKKHYEILNDITIEFFDKNIYLKDIIISPIKGIKGNTEYLALFSLEEKLNREEIESLIGTLF